MSHEILIVDDERDTLTVFTRLLRRFNFAVDATRTLAAASEAIEARRYDVIVTDLHLTPPAGEEGLEVLRRARRKAESTECIVVTGYGNPEVMTKAYELGAAYYFEKPVQPSRLIEAVEELCR